MSEEQTPKKAGTTMLRAMLQEAKARSLSTNLRGNSETGRQPIDAANYGRNFESYARNFESYARNFESYARNFESYARNFENASNRDWGVDPAFRPGVLPDGTRLPPNAATIKAAIEILTNARLKDDSTIAEAAEIVPAALTLPTKPK